MILSSSSVHAVFLIFGFKWLCHRSRHCLPMRPRRLRAISVHFFGPYRATNSMTFSSSSLVHGPLISSGFTTFVQRCWHWTSVRSFKNRDILSHRSPYCSTRDFNAASSCFVHRVLFSDLLLLKSSSSPKPLSDNSDKSSSAFESSSSYPYLDLDREREIGRYGRRCVS